EQVDQLQEALLQIPNMEREIIILRHYGQLSFKEIAEHYQMPIGTALAKVYRGLKHLRKIMTENKQTCKKSS
ncbi:RNA polymerase sigma factor, partial [Planctomycetota bacterium]